MPVVLFADFTGWRKSEVLGLRWHQVDFAAGTVRLEPGTTKNDEGRMFPFGEFPELNALLVRQRTATPVKMGWMTGLEPATTGATVQCSTD